MVEGQESLLRAQEIQTGMQIPFPTAESTDGVNVDVAGPEFLRILFSHASYCASGHLVYVQYLW